MEPAIELSEYVCKLVNFMDQLREQQLLCDVTLAAADGQVKAHSLILAAASPFLCSTFIQLSATEGARLHYNVDLTDFSVMDVCQALHFLYTGQLAVADEEVMSRHWQIVQICDSLGIDKSLLGINKRL
jgi:BTB/POZ domain